VAEWQSGHAADCKSVHAGSIPTSASKIITIMRSASKKNFDSFKICIVGAGYVGMSLGVLLARKYSVVILDIDKDKVNLVNQNKSTIEDSFISEFWKKNKLTIKSTSNKQIAYKDSDFIVICTPTDFDKKTKNLDTKSVEGVIKDSLKYSKKSTLVIKSTVPIGFTRKMRKKFKSKNILFSPEFLREGNALNDNLFPSRIVVGPNSKKAKTFAEILKKSSMKKDTEVFYMNSDEAEAVKLFSNTYLAMRVAFFNELDNLSLSMNLNTESIINGVSSDKRIGDFYNNPSFGFGGYCLPKDTKQLISQFQEIPQALVKSIPKSNLIRKDFVSSQILKLHPDVVGVYLLSMKSESDNFKQSSTIEVIKNLKKKGIKILIFDPSIKKKTFLTFPVIRDLKRFKESSDLIICNRLNPDLKDVRNKIFTRDVFGEH
tara:strand:+ start:1205 stop:2494 length:1290 start_codon:yes stop_codon:yes gene_type:complete